MELLSLGVLIDSHVFMSNVEGSISSISRGFGAAAMVLLISLSVFLSHAHCHMLLKVEIFHSKTQMVATEKKSEDSQSQ